MKHITVIMPLVRECAALECGFNSQSTCHAKAITMGEGMSPECDTFFNVADMSAHAKSEGRIAGVGACKVSMCRFNDDYECMANEVMVGAQMQQAQCVTFSPRAGM